MGGSGTDDEEAPAKEVLEASVVEKTLDMSLVRMGLVPGPATEAKKSITSERQRIAECCKNNKEKRYSYFGNQTC